MKTKSLYTFNWIGGGWNQVYAHTKQEAILEIARNFNGCRWIPDLKTLKRVTSKKRQASWFDNMALMD